MRIIELQTQKRMRSLKNFYGRDRLSEMPDEVIIHILSCMPILYAVRTMLLRRFGDLWTLVHTLNLDMLDFLCNEFYLNRQLKEDKNEQMYVFVRNVLRLHNRPSINKFHVRILLYYSDEASKASGEVKTWVRFALSRQVKELILCDMSNFECDMSNFDIRTTISVRDFTSQSLVTLVLAFCDVETQVQVNLPSLKKLSIDNCGIDDKVLRRFISGCPSLQELEIKDPCSMDISFSAPNIDKLSLVLPDSYDSWEPLPVDCPNLKTLYLDVYDGIVIIDISSVRDIYVKNYPGNSYNDELHTTRKLFYGMLDGVEVLHLSRNVSHAFLDTVQHLDLLQHKWKRVVLELWMFDQVCLNGIHHLMRSLRNLEELTITIHPSWNSKPAEVLEFVKRMLSFPRASASARILFA